MILRTRDRAKAALTWGCASLFLFMLIPGLIESFRTEPRNRWEAQSLHLCASEIATRMFSGEEIIFIDVREPEEFQEFHIPGARSIPLRDLRKTDLSDLHQAALVIPYCLKDFRGFEGARVLTRRGLTNVILMDGFGIKSWKKENLPVAGLFPKLSESEAMALLKQKLEERAP
jgi:rhodanese-related sulfurtransferase